MPAEDRSLRKAVNKAARYILEGRIVEINPSMFYVITENSRHIVRIEGGQLVCSCNGFRARGSCSHVLAVSAILSMRGGWRFVEKNVERRVLRELKRLYRMNTIER